MNSLEMCNGLDDALHAGLLVLLKGQSYADTIHWRKVVGNTVIILRMY